MNGKETRRSLILKTVGAGFEIGAVVLGADSSKNARIASNNKAKFEKEHPDTPTQEEYQSAVAALTPSAEMTIDANGDGVIIVPHAAQAQKEVALYEAKQKAIQPYHEKALMEGLFAVITAATGGIIFFHKPDAPQKKNTGSLSD